MPIFRAGGRIVYVAHVPKAGGTAVTEALTRAGIDVSFVDEWSWEAPTRRWTRSSSQHLTAADLARLFWPGFFDVGFAVVRHPVDRLLSAYAFNRRAIGRAVSFGRFLSLLERRRARHGDLFAEGFDNHFEPAATMVPTWCTAFRLEDGLEAAFDALSDATGVRIAPPPERVNEGRYDVAHAPSRWRRFVKARLFPPSPRPRDLSAGAVARRSRGFPQVVARPEVPSGSCAQGRAVGRERDQRG